MIFNVFVFNDLCMRYYNFIFFSVNFLPGDKVTVWFEKFYCHKCINRKEIFVSPKINNLSEVNGVQLSHFITDDEGCISAADVSQSEFVSLQNQKDKTKQSFTLPCLPSESLPQKSRSILRNRNNIQTDLHTLKDQCYLSMFFN